MACNFERYQQLPFGSAATAELFEMECTRADSIYPCMDGWNSCRTSFSSANSPSVGNCCLLVTKLKGMAELPAGERDEEEEGKRGWVGGRKGGGPLLNIFGESVVKEGPNWKNRRRSQRLQLCQPSCDCRGWGCW